MSGTCAFHHLRLLRFMSFVLLKCIIFIFVTSPNTYLLHQELLNFMLVAMSTQLLYGPSPGPTDTNPFIDAAMAQVGGWTLASFVGLKSEVSRSCTLIISALCYLQENSLVTLVVRRLLLNYIIRPRIPLNSASFPVFSEGSQPGVFQRVGSAAGMVFLLVLSILINLCLFCLFCASTL